jgi:TRAP-type C4-dicarboxylate transport system permease small subunit
LDSHAPGAPPLMRRLEQLCDASAAIGAVVLSAVALMTTVSVIGRAFFSHPILGDVELVQLGGAVVVASFLPYTQFRRANIIVDFFTANAGATAQRLMDAFGVLLYTLTLALITWRVGAGGVSMYQSQERSMLMDLPLWMPYLLMLPGLALCVVIGSLQTAQLLRAPAEEVAA